MPCTQADVSELARELPGLVAAKDRFAFSVKAGAKEKGVAWVWLERVHPREARVPNPSVLAIRVANLEEKESLLALDPEKYFTEPHYDGYPAVLVRLARVSRPEVRRLLLEASRAAGAARAAGGRAARPRRRS